MITTPDILSGIQLPSSSVASGFSIAGADTSQFAGAGAPVFTGSYSWFFENGQPFNATSELHGQDPAGVALGNAQRLGSQGDASRQIFQTALNELNGAPSYLNTYEGNALHGELTSNLQKLDQAQANLVQAQRNFQQNDTPETRRALISASRAVEDLNRAASTIAADTLPRMRQSIASARAAETQRSADLQRDNGLVETALTPAGDNPALAMTQQHTQAFEALRQSSGASDARWTTGTHSMGEVAQGVIGLSSEQDANRAQTLAQLDQAIATLQGQQASDAPGSQLWELKSIRSELAGLGQTKENLRATLSNTLQEGNSNTRDPELPLRMQTDRLLQAVGAENQSLARAEAALGQVGSANADDPQTNISQGAANVSTRLDAYANASSGSGSNILVPTAALQSDAQFVLDNLAFQKQQLEALEDQIGQAGGDPTLANATRADVRASIRDIDQRSNAIREDLNAVNRDDSRAASNELARDIVSALRPSGPSPSWLQDGAQTIASAQTVLSNASNTANNSGPGSVVTAYVPQPGRTNAPITDFSAIMNGSRAQALNNGRAMLSSMNDQIAQLENLRSTFANAPAAEFEVGGRYFPGDQSPDQAIAKLREDAGKLSDALGRLERDPGSEDALDTLRSAQWSASFSYRQGQSQIDLGHRIQADSNRAGNVRQNDPGFDARMQNLAQQFATVPTEYSLPSARMEAYSVPNRPLPSAADMNADATALANSLQQQASFLNARSQWIDAQAQVDPASVETGGRYSFERSAMAGKGAAALGARDALLAAQKAYNSNPTEANGRALARALVNASGAQTGADLAIRASNDNVAHDLALVGER